MKPDRIEELLRQRPPDEPAFRLDAVPIRHRLTRVRPVGGRSFVGISGLAGALIVAVALIVLASRPGQHVAGPSGSSSPTPYEAGMPTAPPGAIPWIADRYVAPTPEPTTAPQDLALCPASKVVLLAGGWSGATGSMGGNLTLINISDNPCRLEAPSAIELRDATGSVIARNADLSMATVLGVPPGGVAGATTVWSNWCGPQPPAGPLRLAVTLRLATDTGVAAATLDATVDPYPGGGSGVPRCDAPSGRSDISAVDFQAVQSTLGGYARQACRSTDLLAFGGEWGVAMSSWYGQVVLFNDSGTDCDLPSRPTVEVRDADGHVVLSAQGQSNGVTAIPAGGSLALQLITADWCTAPPKLPLSLDLPLLSGSLSVDQYPGPGGSLPVPGCPSAPGTPPPIWDVGGYLVPGASLDQPPEDPGDLLSPYVGLALSVPPDAVPGSTVVYTVTLTNNGPYGKGYNLSAECPSYIERLLMTGAAPVAERYLLNCGPAGILAAGGSATFEMRLAVPGDEALGQATIVWQLGQRGSAAKQDLRIVAEPSP